MSHSTWLTRIGVTLFTTIAVGAVGTPAFAASTGTASVSGTKITFKAAAARGNQITITRSGRTVTIDDRVKIKAGKGCKAVKGDRTRVRCTTKKNPTQIAAYLYDGNDTLTNKTNIKITVSAGTGDDRISGGSGHDRLLGESGNDRIWGNAGNDHLDGGSGNDTIDAGSGNDKVYESTGTNKLLGSSGNDYVYGGSGNESLYGGSGNDYVYGYGGNDTLNGDSGNDLVNGGTGDDKVYGGTGDDRLYGDAGNDRLSGGDGNDKEYGGDGDDRFYQATAYTRDADLFVGNAGRDEVLYYGRKVGVRISNDGVTGNDGTMTWDSKTQKAYQTERDTISTDIEILSGTDAADTILGGPNDDVLYGRGGGDTIYGNAGDDFLDGGDVVTELEFGDIAPGTDKLVGGAGDDSLYRGDLFYGDYDTPSSTPRPVGSDFMYGDATVSYEFADGPVTVDEDTRWGGAGQVGERDTLYMYRNLIGSPYDDVLSSIPINQSSTGFLSGGAGDDRLVLEWGCYYYCDKKPWYLFGGDGADVLDGGGGGGDSYRLAHLYGSGNGLGDGERIDDGAADALTNGTVCYLHKTDSAADCTSTTEF